MMRSIAMVLVAVFAFAGMAAAQTTNWQVTEQNKAVKLNVLDSDHKVTIKNKGPGKVVIKRKRSDGTWEDPVDLPSGSEDTFTIPLSGEIWIVRDGQDATGTWKPGSPEPEPQV